MAKDLLDLHGFKNDEVEAAVDSFLVRISNSNLTRASIITGKGTGVVKATTIRYLKMAGYQWAYEKLPNGKENEGCLVIFLD